LVGPTLRAPDRQVAKWVLEGNPQVKSKRGGDPITPGGTQEWKSWRRNGYMACGKRYCTKQY